MLRTQDRNQGELVVKEQAAGGGSECLAEVNAGGVEGDHDTRQGGGERGEPVIVRSGDGPGGGPVDGHHNKHDDDRGGHGQRGQGDRQCGDGQQQGASGSVAVGERAAAERADGAAGTPDE